MKPFGPHYLVHGWDGRISRHGFEFSHMAYVDNPQDEKNIEKLREHIPRHFDKDRIWAEVIEKVRESAPFLAEEAERLRETLPDDPESSQPDRLWYADLFYCHDRLVRLVGTWVARPGKANEVEAQWHAGGWAERPRPPKDIHYMNSLDRRT